MKYSKSTILGASPFTTALTKVFKGSNRLMCGYDEADKAVYVSSSFMLVKLTPEEYDVLVRPVTGRDPGDFYIDNGEVTFESKASLIQILKNAASDELTELAAMPCGFDVSGCKGKLVPYYSKQGDFVTAFNSDYVAVLSGNAASVKAKSKTSGMVCFAHDEPVALILPVRMDTYGNIERAARAWFSVEPKTQDGSVERMINELSAAKRELTESNEYNARLREACDKHLEFTDALKRELDAARDEIDELKTALAAAQDKPEPQPEARQAPVKKAAELMDKLAALDGVTVTVKGAQTTAPVVWLSGDVDAHKAEIEALGGKWSNKRGAWYFKAA